VSVSPKRTTLIRSLGEREGRSKKKETWFLFPFPKWLPPPPQADAAAMCPLPPFYASFPFIIRTSFFYGRLTQIFVLACLFFLPPLTKEDSDLPFPTHLPFSLVSIDDWRSLPSVSDPSKKRDFFRPFTVLLHRAALGPLDGLDYDPWEPFYGCPPRFFYFSIFPAPNHKDNRLFLGTSPSFPSGCPLPQPPSSRLRTPSHVSRKEKIDHPPLLPTLGFPPPGTLFFPLI